jgi:hypothetical protein
MGQQLDGDIAKAQDTLKRARNMEEKYVIVEEDGREWPVKKPRGIGCRRGGRKRRH